LEEQLIQVPAMVTGMNPRADRSWNIKFETRELTGDQVKILADAYQGEGWLVFKPNSSGITMAEVPTEKADSGTKTQAQRLRGSIMVMWQQMGAKGDPEAYYRTYMQKLIEYVQSKLPEEG
jgi:hypothetical protein